MLFALSISGQNETSVLTGCHVLEACEGYCIGIHEDYIYTTGEGKGDEYPANNVQGVYVFKYDKNGNLINMEIDSDENATTPFYFQNYHNDLFIVEEKLYTIVNGLEGNDYIMIYDIENDTIDNHLSFTSNTPDAKLQPIGLIPWEDKFIVLFNKWNGSYNNIVVQYGMDQNSERVEFEFIENYTIGEEYINLSDSTFIIGGFTDIGFDSKTTGFLFKANIEGEIEWEHFIELENPNSLSLVRKVIKNTDEDYLISFTAYDPPGKYKPYIRKIDSNGFELWTKVLGGEHWDYDLRHDGIREIIPGNQSGEYVYIGTRMEEEASPEDQTFGMIGKINEDGNDVWCKKVSIPDKSNLDQVIFSDMQKHEDIYFIVGTFTFKETPENEPRLQQCLLKVDEDGNLIPFNSDTVSATFDEGSNKRITLFPNPTSDYLMLDTKGCSNCKFTIVNSVGQRLKSFTTQSNNETLIIDTSRYRTGLYYLVVENTDISENTKLRFMVE